MQLLLRKIRNSLGHESGTIFLPPFYVAANTQASCSTEFSYCVCSVSSLAWWKAHVARIGGFKPLFWGKFVTWDFPWMFMQTVSLAAAVLHADLSACAVDLGAITFWYQVLPSLQQQRRCLLGFLSFLNKCLNGIHNTGGKEVAWILPFVLKS